MARLEYCEVWTDYPWAGGTRKRFISRPSAAEETIDLWDNTDEATLNFPRAHPALDAVAYGDVVGLRFSDGSCTYREVTERSVASGAGNTMLGIRTVGLGARLARERVVLMDGDGFVFQTVPVAQLPPSTILSSILLNGAPSWLVAGTVTPTDLTDIQFTNDSRLSGLIRLSDRLGTDWELRPIGLSQVAVDLTTRGASAGTLRLRSGKNLLGTQINEGGDHATLIEARGGAADDDEASSLAWAFWGITAIVNNDVTLAPLHGAGPGPIGFDGQGTDYRRLPNLAVNTDPSVALQTGTPTVTRDAFVSLAAGATLHLVGDNDAAINEYFYWPFTAPDNVTTFAVSWIVKKGTSHTSADSLQLYDVTAGVWRHVLNVTWDGAGVPTVTASIGSFVDAVHLGDGVYRIRGLTAAIVPGNTIQVRLLPSAVSATHTGNIYYATMDVCAASQAQARREPWYLEKNDGTVSEVIATNATTQQVTVGNISGFAVGDRVRFVANGAKRHLTELETPERASYGDRRGVFTSEFDDTHAFPDNNTFRAYSNPAGRPDGCTGVIGTATRENGAGNVLTGSYSCKYVVSTVSPFVFHQRSVGAPVRIRRRRHTFSLSAWVRVTALTNGAIGMQLTRAGTPIGRPFLYRGPINSWVQFKAEGLDLSAYIDTTQTLDLQLYAAPDPGLAVSFTCYVDSVMFGPSLQTRAMLEGSGASRIWQGANEWATTIRAKPVTYRFSAADLERAGIPRTAAIVPGQSVVVDDDVFNLRALTGRVYRYRRDVLRELVAEVGISTAPPTLKSKLAKYEPLTIPFFEAVAVKAAATDTRQVAQYLEATITATTDDSITVQLTHAESRGLTPLIVANAFGATIASGSGLGPYVITKPANGAGVGRAVWTAKIAGRDDVSVAVDVPERALGVGGMVGHIAAKTGTFNLRLEGTPATQSWKYAVSTTAMPADAVVTAAVAVNGRALDLTSLATLALDQTLYVKALAYSGLNGTGQAAPGFITGTFRRDTSQKTGKIHIIPASDFTPGDDLQEYLTFVPALYFGGVFPIADRYVLTPRLAGGSVVGTFPIKLPPGVIVTLCRVYLFRGGATANASAIFEEVDPVSGVLISTIASLSQSSGASGYVSSGALTKTLSSSYSYSVRVSLVNRAGTDFDAYCSAVELTYTMPDYEKTT